MSHECPRCGQKCNCSDGEFGSDDEWLNCDHDCWDDEDYDTVDWDEEADNA